MRVNPHLTFNGQCETAFRLYEECLRGKVELMMKYGDSPMAAQVAPDWRPRVAHATFEVDGMELTGGDASPEDYRKPQGIAVLLSLEDTAEAERIFACLSDGGEVSMA